MRQKDSTITEFLDTLAESVTTEDWQAGGALPDILLELRKDGHITDALYAAGARLVRDMTRWHGRSDVLISGYGNRIRGGSSGGLPQGRPDYDAFQRMDRVLAAMRSHERDLLGFCILSRDLDRGSLADWGRQTSAFKNRNTTRAHAIGQVRTMLHSIMETYDQTQAVAA